MLYTVAPTEVGQKVRLIGWGGNIRCWHLECGPGEVVRFTNRGNPVVRLTGGTVLAMVGKQSIEVTDTLGSAGVLDNHGRLLRPTK